VAPVPVHKRIAPEAGEPLSELHQMVAQIERHTDANFLNRVVNDPDVYRWVKGYAIGQLDFSAIAADPRHYVLMGEHGGIVFFQKAPGLYECHTQVLKPGRGEWAKRMARACLHIMFTQTDCLEVYTHVPKGNLGARTLTMLCGFGLEFRKPASLEGWVMDGDPVPTDVFSLRVQDWARTAPGLVERGAWFHRRLEAEFKRLGRHEENHADDDVHDRFVGMAAEFVFGGQPFKGQMLYNRIAAMAGYMPIVISNPRPLTVNIGSAILCFQDGDFYVLKVLGES
jgi:hypothetical protein